MYCKEFRDYWKMRLSLSKKEREQRDLEPYKNKKQWYIETHYTSCVECCLLM